MPPYIRYDAAAAFRQLPPYAARHDATPPPLPRRFDAYADYADMLPRFDIFDAFRHVFHAAEDAYAAAYAMLILLRHAAVISRHAITPPPDAMILMP